MCKTTARGEGLAAYAYTARRGRSVDVDEDNERGGGEVYQKF